ncbi:MAG: dihydroorotate dehydrogenase electron transfer subunit [Clostridiales bacterium]|jgi:dihydroorotate dehydrogenase electron transfer subunit|nr:dihydroorotate dehydrogenase electron transfer subunit [Clostridiales bacterium]
MTGCILSNKRIAPDIFDLRVNAPGLFVQPGQFANVYLDGTDMLLPRPISVCDYENSVMRLVYRVVGKGTAAMAQLKRNDSLRLVAPLGNAFTTKKGDTQKAKRVLLVGGGLGVSPLLYLAKTFRRAGVEVFGAFGFRSPEWEILRADFKGLIDFDVSYDETEQTISAHKGTVIDLIRETIGNFEMVCACGPVPMLKALTGLSQSAGIPLWVSLEEHMACGVGACLCCPVALKDSAAYKRICADGPVFDASAIIWQ